jgi:hypothetical protein
MFINFYLVKHHKNTQLLLKIDKKMSTNLKSSEIFDVSKNNQILLNKIRSVVPFLSAKELPGRHGRDQKPRIK